MKNSTETELQGLTTTEVVDDVEQRLAEIAAALAGHTARSEAADAAPRDLPSGMACPIDPAEREACEACQ